MVFSDYFDIEIREIDQDNLILRSKFKDSYMNEIGAIHGGVLMTLADNASGYAASAKKYLAPTLSMNINFLRPMMETEYIYARAKVIKRGKRIITVDCEVYGDDEKVCAITRAEFAVISDKLKESGSGKMSFSNGKMKKF